MSLHNIYTNYLNNNISSIDMAIADNIYRIMRDINRVDVNKELYTYILFRCLHKMDSTLKTPIFKSNCSKNLANYFSVSYLKTILEYIISKKIIKNNRYTHHDLIKYDTQSFFENINDDEFINHFNFDKHIINKFPYDIVKNFVLKKASHESTSESDIKLLLNMDNFLITIENNTINRALDYHYNNHFINCYEENAIKKFYNYIINTVIPNIDDHMNNSLLTKNIKEIFTNPMIVTGSNIEEQDNKYRIIMSTFIDRDIYDNDLPKMIGELVIKIKYYIDTIKNGDNLLLFTNIIYNFKFVTVVDNIMHYKILTIDGVDLYNSIEDIKENDEKDIIKIINNIDTNIRYINNNEINNIFCTYIKLLQQIIKQSWIF